MLNDPRVDEYIAAAPAFAKPLLTHFRELVHEACPEGEESIKWGRPTFIYRKKILFAMAAFKAHCGFGFFQPGMRNMLAEDGVKSDEGSGSLGRITQMEDFPARYKLRGYLRQAVRLSDEGGAVLATRKVRAPKTPVELPEDLAAALRKHKTAAKAFDGFSPSHRREYIEWITEAKREETRQKRIATTLEWLSKGKTRNSKYVNG